MTKRPPTLADTLARFEALTLEHDALAAEIAALEPRIQAAKDTARRTRDAAIGSAQMRGEHAEETQRQRHAEAEAQRALSDLEQRLTDLEARRTAAFESRYALQAPATLAEIREHQERLTAARAVLADLEGRLTGLDAAPPPPDSSDLEAIETELSEALVKVELGEAPKSLLKDLEARRDKARHAQEAARAEQSRVALLRQGLETRLTGARAEVERLEAAHKTALVWHLLTELETTGAEYRAAADTLHAAYARLHGLSRTLALIDPERGHGVDMRHHDALELPQPRLESTREMPRHRDSRDARAEAERRERARLDAAGITLA